MDNCIVYFSVNTNLANHISARFYNGIHYVWCSPVFDPKALSKTSTRHQIPASSSPKSIYEEFKRSSEDDDNHADCIVRNKAGIKSGALKKRAAGEITDEEHDRIIRMIDKAANNKFAPLLYIIPCHLVTGKVEPVPVEELANPLSEEYRIENLKESEFEIIQY